MKLLLPLLFCISMGASCQITAGMSFGRTSLHTKFHNGSDPFALSADFNAANKIGFISYRQSFFESQLTFNDYSGTTRGNHIEWIEQLAAGAYVYRGNPKVSIGAALEYKLKSLEWFPETTVSYAADSRFAWTGRLAWFRERKEGRLGFLIGFSYQVTKNK